MDDTSFLGSLAKAEVTERGDYLKAGQGVAVIESFHRGTTRSGDTAFLKLRILKVVPKPGKESNMVGSSATKQYQFEKKASPDYRAAIFGNFKRDLCVCTGESHKGITNDKLANLVKQCVPSEVDGKPTPNGGLRGVLINFDSYESKAKDTGEIRDYHNFSLPAQDPKDVQKRVKLLDSGAEAGAFL